MKDTHADYLSGLGCRLQENPEDKDALAELNYAVSDSTYPVNTPEDVVTLIKTAQRIAALPLHNIPQPDEFDESKEAAMVREQVRRLAEGEKFEEPAAQELAPVPGTTDATAQEPAARNPEPGPAALVFDSLAEYKSWAASASQQERETYWNGLSDLDLARLTEDLDQEEEDYFSQLAHAASQPGAATPIDPRPDSFDTYEDYEAFYPDALVLTKEKWLLLKAGLY